MWLLRSDTEQVANEFFNSQGFEFISPYLGVVLRRVRWGVGFEVSAELSGCGD